MTKQEKIREGIIQGVNMILLHDLITRPKSIGNYINPEDTKYRKWLEGEVDKEIIKPLHSQGVVIKMEDWLPTRDGMTCTVEPLI